MTILGHYKLRLLLRAQILAVILVTTATAAHTHRAEWKTPTNETLELYRAGKYELAETVAKRALKTVEKDGGPNHPDVAHSLNNLGLVYLAQGQYAQAAPPTAPAFSPPGATPRDECAWAT